MTLINLKDREAHLWHAAHIITGPIDASDYKTYIFPILFFKRICDVYDEEFEEVLAKVGNAELAREKIFHRIQVPVGSHWDDVFTKSHDIGDPATLAWLIGATLLSLGQQGYLDKQVTATVAMVLGKSVALDE